MAEQWYFQQDGVERGPFNAKMLLHLAREGRLQPNDLVRRDDVDRWFPATKVRGLVFGAPRNSLSDTRTGDTPTQTGRSPRNGSSVSSSRVNAPSKPIAFATTDTGKRIQLLSDGTWVPHEEEQLIEQESQEALDALFDDDPEDVVEAEVFEDEKDMPRKNGAAPVLYAVTTKAFGIPRAGSSDDPPAENLSDFETSLKSVSQEIRTKTAHLEAEMRELGFELELVHSMEFPHIGTKIVWLTYSHPRSKAMARIHYRIWRNANPVKEYCYPMFITPFKDGRWLISTAGKPDMLAPKNCTIHRRFKAKATSLWDAHEKRLEELQLEATPAPVRDRDVKRLTEQLHSELRDFHLKRGVFRPLNEKELTQLQAKRESEKGYRGMQNPEILAEMDRLQTKASWKTTIIVFVVSLIAFLLLGNMERSWKTLGLLVGVLFLHELGHYLAMLLFGYKNLRMFFIPLFGAAVSGKHYNVPGWKKVVVSLMGPLPGILLAIPLGIGGITIKQNWMIEASMLMLLVNAFNLLPVLPLDGGWMVHAVVFSRHPLADVGFRIAAAFCLLTASLLPGMKGLMYLGIGMLVQIPMAYRSAKVVSKLREELGQVKATDADKVPPEVADRIITELKSTSKKRMNDKLMAQSAVQVYESLNAKPPGVLASLSFLFLQFGSMFVAFVMCIVLVFASQGMLGKLLVEAAVGPQRPLSLQQIRHWDGKQATRELKTTKLIADFEQLPPAEKMFTQLSAELPAGCAMNKIGSTLIVRFAEKDTETAQKWFDKLKPECSKVSILNPEEGASFRLSCLVEDKEDVTAIVNEASLCASNPQMHLIPPWMKDDPRTPEERKNHARARFTYSELQNSDWSKHTDKEAQKRVMKELMEARMRRNKKETERLQKEQEGLTKAAQEKARQELKKQGPDKVDLKLIDLYDAWNTERQEAMTKLFNRAKEKKDGEKTEALQDPIYDAMKSPKYLEMVQRLGPMPMINGKVDPKFQPYELLGGYIHNTGPFVSFDFLRFADEGVGMTRLVEWLTEKKCTQLKYDTGGELGGLLINGGDDEDEEEE